MINIGAEGQAIADSLGQRLKNARLARNESQELFSQRLGLSRQTYSKMENGVVTIPLGYWLAASDILDRLSTWKNVMEDGKDLFAQYEQKQSGRKKASGWKKAER